jgi:thiamine kinase-like enzyme
MSAAAGLELDSVLDRFPALDARPRRYDVLAGGLTNRNYRVTTDSGRRAVARCSSDKSTLLAIDRDAEHRNSRLAASAGVGPEVLGYAPDAGVLVVEWLEGRTLDNTDLDDAATLARVAALCHELHAGPQFAGDFDMFEIQQRYLAIVESHGFRVPAGYHDLLPQADLLRSALAERAEPTVPCHNDLLAANMIDDGSRLWFIDYEYAGNNDPYFELGNLWSETGFGAEHLRELVTAYVGHESRSKLARAELYALMALYGWTLWASIQDAVSEVEFDFWSWGMEKYDRAVAGFASPHFARLITEVQLVDEP